jgi:hypothetical protein
LRLVEAALKAVRGKSLLAAFCFLRDSDVHDRTLSTSPAMWHTVNLAEQTMASALKLNEYDLNTIEKLREYPWAGKALAADSVLSISEKALGELRAVVQGRH